MKKLILLISLLCLGFASCDKGGDDPKPVVPPVEKKVEITVNFGSIPTDFKHEGGLVVNAVALFTADLNKEIAVFSYSYPTMRQTLVGEPASNYLGKEMYLYVRARKTLEGFSAMDHSHSWDVEIYVKISELKEKNNVYVEFPADHQYMVIGKP